MTRRTEHLEIVRFTEQGFDVCIPRNKTLFGIHNRLDVIYLDVGACMFFSTGIAPVMLRQASSFLVDFLRCFSSVQSFIFRGPLA
jgi:hypothetical protein